MVFGIGSILLAYPWPLGFASAIIGLFLSAHGIKSSRRRMAIAGLICSIFFLGLIAVLTVEEVAGVRPHRNAAMPG